MRGVIAAAANAFEKPAARRNAGKVLMAVEMEKLASPRPALPSAFTHHSCSVGSRFAVLRKSVPKPACPSSQCVE
jgi:hypothetical protein